MVVHEGQRQRICACAWTRVTNAMKAIRVKDTVRIQYTRQSPAGQRKRSNGF